MLHFLTGIFLVHWSFVEVLSKVYFRCLEALAKRAGLPFQAVDQTMQALLLRCMLLL